MTNARFVEMERSELFKQRVEIKLFEQRMGVIQRRWINMNTKWWKKHKGFVHEALRSLATGAQSVGAKMRLKNAMPAPRALVCKAQGGMGVAMRGKYKSTSKEIRSFSNF